MTGESLRRERMIETPQLKDVRLGAQSALVNVAFDGPFKELSNLSAHSFTLDGKRYGSVEAFIQALKIDDTGPKSEKRERIEKLTGYEAQRAGKKPNTTIRRSLEENGKANVYYNGQSIGYRSPEHLELIDRAIEAKFRQNEDARIALLATGKRPIAHELGKAERRTTSLPAAAFVEILERVRQKLTAAQANDAPIDLSKYSL